MENKKASSFIFGIIAIIIGVRLYKEFNFENLKFEKPALAIVYSVVFIFSIYILGKNLKNKLKNKNKDQNIV